MMWIEIDNLTEESGSVIVAKRGAPKIHIAIDMVHAGWYYAKTSSGTPFEVLKYIEAGFTHFSPMFKPPATYD